MNCDDCENLIAEYALESLDPIQAEQVEAHLRSGCVKCGEALRAARDAWGAVAEIETPLPPPARVKDELLARVREESAKSNAARDETTTKTLLAPSASAPARRSWAPFVAAAILGVIAGYAFSEFFTVRPNLIDQYRARLQDSEKAFGGADVRLAALRFAGDRTDVRGSVVWDGVAGQLHAYIFGVPSPPQGFIHRLWFVAKDGAWIPVGDLEVGPDEVAAAVLDAPKTTQAIVGAVISIEPREAPESDVRPHGEIRLEGDFVS